MGPQIRFASRQRVGVITEARDLHGIVYLVVPPVDEFCGELQETAFTTALEAYAAKYPNKSVDDVVEGRHRGYNADERSLAGDVWHHRILVIQAIGTDTNGNDVPGYWYDYDGGGTYAPTTKRTTGLMQFIRNRLSSTAVVVTKVRNGSYEPDGRAYLGLKRDARDITPTLRRAPAQSNADRLNELKTNARPRPDYRTGV